jgi:hypothetical protein
MGYKITTNVKVNGSLSTTESISASDIVIQGKKISDYFNLANIESNPEWQTHSIHEPSWDSIEVDTLDWDDPLETPVERTIYDIIGTKADVDHIHSNLLTVLDIEKLESIGYGANKNIVLSIFGRTGNVLLTKDDIGLDLVDNTSDLEKPVSLSIQDALDLKDNHLHFHTDASHISDGFMKWQDKVNLDVLIGNGLGSIITDHTLLNNIGSNTHLEIDSLLDSQTTDIDALESTFDNHSHMLNGNYIISAIDTNLGQTTWKQNSSSLILFQFKSVGFLSGGNNLSNGIDTFVFSTNSNASSHGSLLSTILYAAGSSSKTNGFVAGNGYYNGGYNFTDNVYTFNFSSIVTSTLHSSLSSSKGYCGSSQSDTQSFVIGGYSSITAIDKFDHANTSSVVSHGNITTGRYSMGGQNSTTHGFISAGNPNTNNIEKFLFTNNTVSSLHGNLSLARGSLASSSSSDKGFGMGGHNGSFLNTIDRFDFATITTSVSLGSLTVARIAPTGISSDIQGYTCGGNNGPVVNTIDKFTFASLSNAVDHGDLTSNEYGLSGHEV